MERGYVDGDDNDNDCYDDSKYNSSRTSSSSSVPSPDRFSYNTVIAALANESFTQGAASNRRQKQQRKRKNQYQSRKDTQTKENALIDDSNQYENENKKEKSCLSAAERAEALLGRMRIRGIEPDVVGYNAVISAWSRSGEGEESARRAECVLASIEENQGNIHQHQYVRPNTVSYSSVIDAWSKSGASDGPNNAEAVLKKMESLRDKGDVDASPNIIAYNSVINAWSKSGERGAAESAESILCSLERGSNLSSLSSSENGHEMRSGSKMRKQSLHLLLPQPNYITYCSVINAWAYDRYAKDKAVRARFILDRMMEQARDGSTIDVPNHASRNRSSIERSKEMLRNAHNMVLDACARLPFNAGPSHQRNSLQILIKTYNDATIGGGLLSLSSSFKPDDVTYANAIRAFARLKKKLNEEVDIDSLIEQAYIDCQKGGLVTNLVLRTLKRDASPILCSKLLVKQTKIADS